jgi:tRNA(Arg) A34 adenosine deaminase TadA
MTPWAELGPQWQACLELAWVAYGRNTTPVGAILVDGDGKVVAEGTNARYAPSAGGALAGSHLAHAEVIALAGLSAETGYPDHTLYTTLEPCLLCVGAAVMSSVGHVQWAGVDLYGGATGLPRADNAHLRRGLTTFTGPRDDVLGTFAAALHVEFYLRRKPDGHVVAAYEGATPEIVAAARVLAEMGLYGQAAGGASAAENYDRAVSTLLGRINLRPG